MGEGNIAIHSRKRKRYRCKECGQTFSERQGTALYGIKKPEGLFATVVTLLAACWQAFDRAVGAAEGRELRKGPRGGGRDVVGIVQHAIGGDQAYLSALGAVACAGSRPHADPACLYHE